MDLSRRWSVRVCTGCKKQRMKYYTNSYLHKDMTEENKYMKSGYGEEDLRCWMCHGETEEVQEENWTVSDLIDIFEGELEDRNYHEFTELPRYLVDSLSTIEITEEDKKKVLKEFMDKILY